MKKLTLLVVFIAVVGFSIYYLARSGVLFAEGVEAFKNKENSTGGFAFLELVETYPYSPTIAVAKVYMASQKMESIPGLNLKFLSGSNLTYLDAMDMYYQGKSKKNLFEAMVGKSPAYFDPFFFAAIAYFLVITMIAALQRMWAGSKGLGMRGIISRCCFAVTMLFLYFLWVQGAYESGSGVYKIAGSISSSLNTVFGATAVTTGFSGLMLLFCILVSLMTLFTFLGKPKEKK